MTTDKYDAVILADGDYPKHSIPLQILAEAEFLVCCDNAGKELIEQKGRIPDAIVGDGDSVPDSFKKKHKGIYHQVTEQDYNDLTKATRFTIAHLKEIKAEEPYRIAYLGATGKREDHTIGNIALMNFYRKVFGIQPVMVTDYGIFTAHEGCATLPSFLRQQVSIFNIDANRIESENLKWSSYAYKELWQGTLNEALSDTFTLRTDGSFIVYRTHEPKVIRCDL